MASSACAALREYDLRLSAVQDQDASAGNRDPRLCDGDLLQLKRAEARLDDGVQERPEARRLHARIGATLRSGVGTDGCGGERHEDLAPELPRRIAGGVGLHVGAGKESLPVSSAW